MPPNRLLRRADLDQKDAGYYIQREVPKGRHITAADLGDCPLLRPQVGELLIALPLRGDVPNSPMLNAGETGALCPGAANVPPLRVTAVLCSPSRTRCVAMVSAPPAQAAAIAAALARPGSTMLASTQARC